MSYSGHENYGLWRAVSKQVELRVDQYDGQAREGEIIVDGNPGPGQYQLYIGNRQGNLIPIVGKSSVDVDHANTANVAYTVDGANVAGTVEHSNHAQHAKIADVAHAVAAANIQGIILSSNHAHHAQHAQVADVANTVQGANVIGSVANSHHASRADAADNALRLTAESVFNVRIGGGAAGEILHSDGAGGTYWATLDLVVPEPPAPVILPAIVTAMGPTQSVQFNNAGGFDGHPTFTYDAQAQLLSVPRIVASDQIEARSFRGNLRNGESWVGIDSQTGSIDFAVDSTAQWSLDGNAKWAIRGNEGHIGGNTNQTLILTAGAVILGTVNNTACGGSVDAIVIRGGNAGDSVDAHGGEGGDILLIGGGAGGSSGGAGAEGGSIQFTTGAGGDGAVGGSAGSVEIITNNGGDGLASNGGNGGALNITIGDGGEGLITGGAGGSYRLFAGDGGDSETGDAGAGGDIYIVAGNAGHSNDKSPAPGGNVYITAGTSSGTDCTGGEVVIKSGDGDQLGKIDLAVTNSTDPADHWLFYQDQGVYGDPGARLSLPQWRNGAQSISGTITTVAASPAANDNKSSAGVLNCYTASSSLVWAVKLTVYLSHNTSIPRQAETEIMEYYIARSGSQTLQIQQNSYLASNSSWTAYSGLRSTVSASINTDGVIVATVTATTGSNIVVNYTATEFLLDSKS